jgi:hypothetical protein
MRSGSSSRLLWLLSLLDVMPALLLPLVLLVELRLCCCHKLLLLLLLLQVWQCCLQEAAEPRQV